MINSILSTPFQTPTASLTFRRNYATLGDGKDIKLASKNFIPLLDIHTLDDEFLNEITSDVASDKPEGKVYSYQRNSMTVGGNKLYDDVSVNGEPFKSVLNEETETDSSEEYFEDIVKAINKEFDDFVYSNEASENISDEEEPIEIEPALESTAEVQPIEEAEPAAEEVAEQVLQFQLIQDTTVAPETVTAATVVVVVEPTVEVAPVEIESNPISETADKLEKEPVKEPSELEGFSIW